MENRIKILESQILELKDKLDKLYEEINRSFNYISSDPNGSLNKARIILETIMVEIYEKEMGIPPKKNLLGDILLDNQFTRKIERRIISRINSIRDMTNIGTHGLQVTKEDALDVLQNLINVVSWYLAEYKNHDKKVINANQSLETAILNSNLDDLYEKQEYKSIIEICRNKIDLNAQSVNFYMAKAFYKLRNYDSAKVYINNLEKEFPTSNIVLELSGRININLKNYEKVQQICTSISKNSPDYYFILYLNGLIYYYKENYIEALNKFNQAKIINISNSELLGLIGACYFYLKNLRKAIEYFEMAIETDQKNSFACVFLANIYIENVVFGQKYQMEFLLNKAIESDYLNSDAYAVYGRYHYKRKNFNSAISYYIKCLDIDPQRLDMYIQIAWVYTMQKKENDALDYINKYINIFPRDPNGYLNRHKIHLNFGNFVRATADLIKSKNL